MRKFRFHYNGRIFAGDVFGGLMAALIALPYGLSMAALMGLPPVLGLFTSIATAPIIALLGRNAVMIGGTASPTLPFIVDAVKRQGVGGAAKISIVAATFLMIFSVLRLGRHIQKVPQTVVTGFSCGIGAMMIILQLDTIFGLGAAGRAGNYPLAQMFNTFGRLDGTRWQPLLLSVVVIAICQGLAMYWKKFPGPLVAVGVALAMSQGFGMHEKEVGLLPLEVPPLAGFSWSPMEVRDILLSGFGLAFVVAVYVLLTARVVEHFRGRHAHGKAADSDAELGAYGIANIVAGIFGAPVSVGIPARSVANVRCGGTTRMSNLIHAVFLILLIWLGGDIVSHIPMPALAGVTAWMGFCLLDWSAWRRLPKMRKTDAAAFLTTAIAVLITNAVLAVALGCACYGVRVLWNRFVGDKGRPSEAGSPAATTRAATQIPAQSR